MEKRDLLDKMKEMNHLIELLNKLEEEVGGTLDKDLIKDPAETQAAVNSMAKQLATAFAGSGKSNYPYRMWVPGAMGYSGDPNKSKSSWKKDGWS